MKIISFHIKNLDGFLEKLKDLGYSIELGAHSVLLDHSELTSITVKKKGSIELILIIHYITPYYRVETMNISDEDKYLKELIRIKHSGEKWKIPVNPVIGVVMADNNEELMKMINDYKDDYPVKDADKLLDHYRSRNPRYQNIPRLLLARILDELSGYRG
ncbi:hypothetical protein [Staphylothermus hellenicus]|uniref:Uncharacterized protein n=1 Tax=Staphylothermus hellenicus (strain DSM 12710 / JCM 10830 / BK20S6-10-b1 / P8) TaxID=591019 RepID=D7D9F5_STAHD|nr:hypothetical protein [Staphylothermus hellenicus]ADI32401.1 hypothetical protein Shell_1308 [Staphylothermus hellenicus DSM 12710]